MHTLSFSGVGLYIMTDTKNHIPEECRMTIISSAGPVKDFTDYESPSRKSAREVDVQNCDFFSRL